MKNLKFQITTIFIIIFVVLFFNVYGTLKNFNNENVRFNNEYKLLQNKRDTFYDMLWNTFDTKSKVSGISKESFVNITQVIMESRKDGVNVTWKWLQENQNIDYNEYTKFYSDLSNYIEVKREEMYKIDLEVLGLVKNQNNFVLTWPNWFLNKYFFDYPLLDFEKFKKEKTFNVQ